MSNKQNLIERIEKDLLTALLDYVVPFLNKKIRKPKRAEKGNLENIILNSKPKIGLKDFKEMENILLGGFNGKNNGNVNAKSAARFNSTNAFYSLNMARKRSPRANNYSITVKYEENGSREKLAVEIRKDGKGAYSAETVNEKESKDKVAPYKVTITYEDRYGEERLAITYKQQLRNYMKKHIEDKEDMTNRVPLKWLNILPESMMGGVLGFTYLGENFMGRRADLTGKTARMVDIHESIHTPDEYETRCLTLWIMSKERSKYIR